MVHHNIHPNQYVGWVAIAKFIYFRKMVFKIESKILLEMTAWFIKVMAVLIGGVLNLSKIKFSSGVAKEWGFNSDMTKGQQICFYGDKTVQRGVSKQSIAANNKCKNN